MGNKLSLGKLENKSNPVRIAKLNLFKVWIIDSILSKKRGEGQEKNENTFCL